MGEEKSSGAITKAEKSVLLISRTPSTLQDVEGAVSEIPKTALTTHGSSVFEMNGHAAQMAVGSDVVIFETDANHDDEISAISWLVNGHNENTVFIALTDSNLPIAKARRLTRAGVDEILPVPFSSEELAELLRKSLQGKATDLERTSPAQRAQGSIIAVSQARGGIGATTIAVNLACLLQDRRGLLRKQAQHRVAIVDLDLQFGNVGIFLDVEDAGAMMQIAKSGEPPDEAFVRTAMIRHKCGLAVLPAPAQPMPLDALEPEQVASLLDALRAEYDYVVVDMPHALVPWIAPVLSRASKMMIATDTTVPGVRHARRLIDFYMEDSPVLPIEIIIVHEKRPIFFSHDQKQATAVLERPLSHWLPHDGIAAVEAMDRGQPVVEFRRSSKLAKALGKLAKAVATSLPVRAAPSVSSN